MPWVISSWISMAASAAQSKRSAQRCFPSVVSMSCTVNRSLLPAEPQAAVHDVADAEGLAHFAGVRHFALVSERGRARDHQEAGDAGEKGDDVLRETVGEKLEIRIP